MNDVDYFNSINWVKEYNQNILKYRLEQLYGKTN
jgi:hypothetical protein